jgi:hypothetical protein
MVKHSRKRLLAPFCSCIKKVRKTVRLRPTKRGTRRLPSLAKRKEQAAIAICVKSVLQTRRRTLRRFSCEPPRGKRPFLQTQPPLAAAAGAASAKART